MNRIWIRLFLCTCFLLSYVVAFSQFEEPADYREEQHLGLGRAASEIFFSDKKFTFSGYGEFSFVTSGEAQRDISAGDVELYYDNLFRVVPFVGFRLSSRVFLIGELGFEYIQGGDGDVDWEFFPEAYFDILLHDALNIRAGFQPLTIGYINNNDEPVLFYSVNRPETERLVIPTEWISPGISFYGHITRGFDYAIGFVNGLDAEEFIGPTWIRGGKEHVYQVYRGYGVNAQLNTQYIPNSTLSISGYAGINGTEGNEVEIQSSIMSAYYRFDLAGWSVIAMGAYGSASNTSNFYQYTLDRGDPQILGETVFGTYVEVAYDLFQGWDDFKAKTEQHPDAVFRRKDAAFPIFVRYERMNSHLSVAPQLDALAYPQQDLDVWLVGFNYRPNDFTAVKVDVQFRRNLTDQPVEVANETLFELGLGIEF
ncbi:hypothetical protein [Pontibacter sp. G13]|uniref:hypothetical protein n=1 Tax=Pontibacter sp. G13 TaxID=3074898 RepID=UPI00288C42FE|nr:hypothetical protein [Pontibacter sp. G13]WNJ18777.1 hypothetical protein RJD25_28305 [Pontibacter sp. G13]